MVPLSTLMSTISREPHHVCDRQSTQQRNTLFYSHPQNHARTDRDPPNLRQIRNTVAPFLFAFAFEFVIPAYIMTGLIIPRGSNMLAKRLSKLRLVGRVSCAFATIFSKLKQIRSFSQSHGRPKAPSTRIRIFSNPQLFLSGCGYRPHVSGEFDSESGKK